jgi:hypothetical protein
MSNVSNPLAGLCRRLRWKGMFIEVPQEAKGLGGTDQYCWCTHTMNCLGPDGKVAAKDSCLPGRPCHERV